MPSRSQAAARAAARTRRGLDDGPGDAQADVARIGARGEMQRLWDATHVRANRGRTMAHVKARARARLLWGCGLFCQNENCGAEMSATTDGGFKRLNSLRYCSVACRVAAHRRRAAALRAMTCNATRLRRAATPSRLDITQPDGVGQTCARDTIAKTPTPPKPTRARAQKRRN